MHPKTPRSALFPYTTLFRSSKHSHGQTEDECREPTGAEGRVRQRAKTNTGQHPGHQVLPEPASICEDGVQRRLDLDLDRSEEHTSELQSRREIVCRLLHEKK